ncbi:MAG: hypothetical protein EON58_16590, partial [Alphaproteobacteria bacterium]
VVGVADFRGNGRQGAITGKDNSKAARMVDGAWVYSTIGAKCNNPENANERRYCAVGDVNGDGTTDLVQTNAATRNSDVWLSTGSTFIKAADGLDLPGSPILRDMDNDGTIDFVSNPDRMGEKPFQSMSIYALQFSGGTYSMVASGSSVRGSAWSGDFNGDGLPDFVRNATDLSISNSGTGNPNLLRTVTLETGGKISVDYYPSTRWSNSFLPQVMHAVTKLKVEDGRGTIATTDYAYAGGLYDTVARKFLGYKTITVTKPLANGEASRPVVTITYRQDLASYGLPSNTVSRNGEDTKSKTVAESYSVRTASKPYRALNTATETTIEEGSSLVLRTERSFDAYGNVTEIKDYGRKDLDGDETWTTTNYAPNLDDYQVSYPRSVRVRSGGFTSELGISEKYTINYYDDASANATPPTKGNLTRVRYYKQLDPADINYAENFTYDANGNRLSHADAMGNRTEWDYDPAYKLHVVKERAPKYFANGSQPADTRFETTFANDNVCGKPSAKMDWNDIV